MNPVGRWAALAGAVALGAVAAAGLVLAVYAALLFKDLPSTAELAEYRAPTSTRAYASDGTLIAELGQERRIFTPYDQIPPMLMRAFLAAEDHNFFQHGGIDVQGLGRAATRDLLGAATGHRLQGGSTITQQVAKNILLSNEVTFGRKIKEAILAQRIEQTLPKSRILEIYLNQIPLGYQSYGVGAAAYNYFGKPLHDLDLAQMAYLAALPKGPNNYHPIRHKAAAIARRNWILGEMASLSWVSRASAQAAMHEDLVVQTKPMRAHYRDADYFVEEVRLRARGTIDRNAENAGLYLRTTLDSRLQSLARASLMKGLESYDHRHGWRGPWAHVEPGQDWQALAKARPRPWERRDWRAALVDSANGAGVRVTTLDGVDGDLDGGDVAWANASKPLKAGDLIFVEPGQGDAKRFNLRQIPIVNGAIVALEPRSGRILAMVGGYSFSLSKFNRATQARRQPGSSFKPFVYATALENGFTPASEVLDAPIYLNGGGGKVYSPENFEHRYSGMTAFRNGLVYSKNTMTVRIAQRVGMKKIVAAAERDGVVTSMAPVLAMALGAGETTPFDITSAYAAFANGGRRIQPHLIELAEDHTGHVVWKADRRACPGCGDAYDGQESPRVAPDGAQVMDPITAYQISLMLEGVTTRGTAAAVSSLGRHIAGKTGTTNDFRSAWFVGYTPDIVVGVFVGFDDDRSLGDNETGAVDAVPIFIDFMKDALKDTPNVDFAAPKTAKIAYAHGNREAFQPGTEPKPPPPRPARAPPVAGQPPIPYGQAFPNGQLPPAAAPPPPPKKAPKDLNGLY